MAVEITHVVRYLENAGATVNYPEAELEMSNLEASEVVTFTGNTAPFVSQPPLVGYGVPPTQVIQGESVSIPITVTNRSEAEVVSGTVHLHLTTLTGTLVYSTSQEVSVPASGSVVTTLLLVADVPEGTYLIAASVESNGGSYRVFEEYLVVPHRIYLPVILKSF